MPRTTLPPIYPILDSGAGPWPALGLTAAAAALVEGGARILQVRHKGHWSRDIFAQARETAALCRQAGAVLIIDDRADIAALLGAGLHVGQDDLAPADARRIVGSSAVVGFSTHNPEQLRAAAGEPVDYLALGPIFPTASKRDPDPVVGLEQLRSCRSTIAGPLVAIGGITRANAHQVWAAGADSVAVIGDFITEPCTAASLRRRMEEWLQSAPPM
ncbi:MAG TPA: thiamine phosphate synthase [Bryobacteraceae bacterium]|nr:thiamine phosphate synthase [Bryobacteraceae bacterium]